MFMIVYSHHLSSLSAAEATRRDVNNSNMSLVAATPGQSGLCIATEEMCLLYSVVLLKCWSELKKVYVKGKWSVMASGLLQGFKQNLFLSRSL